MLITCDSTLLRLLVLSSSYSSSSTSSCCPCGCLPLLVFGWIAKDCTVFVSATANEPTNQRLRLCYSERSNEPTSSSPVQLTTQRTNDPTSVISSILKVSIQLLTGCITSWDLWRNGSASDSRSEGCVFDSRRVQKFPEI